VVITSPKDGDEVDDSFELKYELTKGSQATHAHVYVDGQYQKGFSGTLKGLSLGDHKITVTGATSGSGHGNVTYSVAQHTLQTPRIGTLCTAPSYLSAQAAYVNSREIAASTSCFARRFPHAVIASMRAANSAPRADKFSAM